MEQLFCMKFYCEIIRMSLSFNLIFIIIIFTKIIDTLMSTSQSNVCLCVAVSRAIK